MELDRSVGCLIGVEKAGIEPALTLPFARIKGARGRLTALQRLLAFRRQGHEIFAETFGTGEA